MKASRTQVVPFFIFNHLMDPLRVRRWVRECAATGVDGLFIHPREGLLTPYLSEAWFEVVGACIEEAKRCGIKAWLYDEFPYPSGVAGGKVVETDPRFAERHLRVQRHRVRGGLRRQVELGTHPVLRAFLMPVRGGKADRRAARDVTAWIGPRNDDWILRDWDSRWYYPPKYARLYDCPRSSANHPQAVFQGDLDPGEWELTVFCVHTGGDFIEPFGHYVDVSNREATETFLRVTHEEYYRRFGREFNRTIPGFFTDEPKYRNLLPWSDSIAAEWKDYQKDPKALLALIEGDPRTGDARQSYRETAFRLFRDNWARPISNWCSRHKVHFCGHISPEEDWMVESAITGSILQLLKTFHVPGCDLIIPAVGDRDHPILNFTASLAVSAAAQSGKTHALCEVFGASNYQLNMQDMKRITDWLAFFGINVFTHHCLFYSIDGYRKYDAPPTFYRPSTLWPHLKSWIGYMRGASDRLGPLNVKADVVLVRPMRTFWRLGNERQAEMRSVYERAMRLALSLLERGLMFQWVDDLDLAQAAVSPRGEVRIGKAHYKMMAHFAGSLDPQAAKEIRRLKKAGARVLTDSEAERLHGPLRSERGDIRAVRNTEGAWLCLNLCGKRRDFTLDGKHHWLDGYESRWISPGQDALAPPSVTRALRLSSSWEMTPESDNVFVLTDWTVNGRPTRPLPYYEMAATGELGAMDAVSLGRIPKDPALTTGKRLIYRTRFKAQNVRDLSLVCDPGSLRGKWRAFLNGKLLDAWRRTSRYDIFNIEHDLRRRVCAGTNRLEFIFDIEKATDGLVDFCRLFGAFFVKQHSKRGARLLPPVQHPTGSGDWRRHGFPHYSGIMKHRQTFRWDKQPGERVELKLSRPPRDQMEVRLNGRRAGELLWSPWRLDITEALRSGNNLLELRVSNTLDNFIYGRSRPSGLDGRVTLEARRHPAIRG